MGEPRVINRRRFLKGAAAGLGVAALALPALGGRALGAAERIHFGVIGCGGDHCGRGTDHLQNLVKRSAANETGATGNNVEVIGICDIYERHKRQAKEIAPKAEVYHDFRKLLERKDLDAVVIAPPITGTPPWPTRPWKRGRTTTSRSPRPRPSSRVG